MRLRRQFSLAEAPSKTPPPWRNRGARHFAMKGGSDLRASIQSSASVSRDLGSAAVRLAEDVL